MFGFKFDVYFIAKMIKKIISLLNSAQYAA